MTSLTNKVAIVTGASSGIGRAIAERLGKEGASVVVNYATNRSKAEEVVANIEAAGSKALAVQADMSQVADIRRLVQETISHFGQFDILVNNAGSGTISMVADVTEAEFDAVFGVNVRGVLFALQEAARHMGTDGRIVNISSSVTVYPQPSMAIYAASKAAVKLLTEVVAKEIGSRGITINTIMPGATVPGMAANVPPEMQKLIADSSPFGRLGQTADIADVVAFLVSQEARWITGQHILVNGGASY